MFRRKIENTMLSWKQSNNRKPLVIKWCRQCGKTSSVLEFARKLGDYNVGMKGQVLTLPFYMAFLLTEV